MYEYILREHVKFYKLQLLQKAGKCEGHLLKNFILFYLC